MTTRKRTSSLTAVFSAVAVDPEDGVNGHRDASLAGVEAVTPVGA